MAVKLPLVMTNGQVEQLQSSDIVAYTNQLVPFYRTGGTYDPFAVVASKIPFYRTNGTADNFPLG